MGRFAMQSAPQSGGIDLPPIPLAFVGSTVDDRGKAATDFVAGHASLVTSVQYDRDELQVILDGAAYTRPDLEDYLGNRAEGQVVLFETTTLGFMELFLLCVALRDSGGGRAGFLYTEPAEYKKLRSKEVLNDRDFELSEEVEDFTGVPGSAILLRPNNPARGVFLVGYEGERLDQAFEQTILRPSDCAVVFGVPAFQPGWEMHSFANNYGVLKERSVDELLYAGAQNPSACYAALQRIYRSCTQDQRMVVAPIGTKPHGIGAAVFACDEPSIGLLYDNPRRSRGRSKLVAHWHYYEAPLGQ